MTSSIRLRQAAVVVGRAAARSILGRRAVPVLLLAAMPVLLALVRALLPPGSERAAVATSTTEFANVFRFFILRFVVFITTAVVFVNLFRGEMLQRSLHYTLLAPLRRDLLVIGSYLGGLLGAVPVLAATTAVTWGLYYLPNLDGAPAAVLTGTILGHLLRYLGVVVLSCAAYGALFTLAGLLVRNPMLPILLLLGWEMLVPFLPPLLKALSVIHYLDALVPVPPSLGAFALLASPPGPWTAIGGLIVVGTLALAGSVWRAKRLEIRYGTD